MAVMGTGVQVIGWYESKPKKAGVGTVCGVAAMQVSQAGRCFFVSSFAANSGTSRASGGEELNDARVEDREAGDSLQRGTPEERPGEESKGDGEFNNKEA